MRIKTIYSNQISKDTTRSFLDFAPSSILYCNFISLFHLTMSQLNSPTNFHFNTIYTYLYDRVSEMIDINSQMVYACTFSQRDGDWELYKEESMHHLSEINFKHRDDIDNSIQISALWPSINCPYEIWWIDGVSLKVKFVSFQKVIPLVAQNQIWI